MMLGIFPRSQNGCRNGILVKNFPDGMKIFNLLLTSQSSDGLKTLKKHIGLLVLRLRCRKHVPIATTDKSSVTNTSLTI